MLFSMRDSCSRFPLLLERPLKGFHFISPHLGSRPKPLPSVTVLFLLKYNVVLLGVAVEGSTTFPWLIFQRRELLFPREVSEGGLKAYLNILAPSQASPIIDSTVPSLDCVISVSTYSGGLHHHLGGRDLWG